MARFVVNRGRLGSLCHFIVHNPDHESRSWANLPAQFGGLIHADGKARVISLMPHGNIYVNRSMIGAVVGSQPFGGSALSGIGLKAGGLNYLHRFSLEQVIFVDTSATGAMRCCWQRTSSFDASDGFR